MPFFDDGTEIVISPNLILSIKNVSDIIEEKSLCTKSEIQRMIVAASGRGSRCGQGEVRQPY
jgi:hypothetical protein